MTERSSARKRGPYAQGRQSRELVLDTALAVIGRQGFGATSLKDIAEEVGMTQAGLLHHFQTKENLLTEVLRRRDVVNQQMDAPHEAHYPRAVYIAHESMKVPGLLHLYVNLEAAASDPKHPSHRYFLERDAAVDANVARDIEARQGEGRFDPRIDPQVFARILIALFDGLQAEIAIDPRIDLPGTLEALWDMFASPAESAGTDGAESQGATTTSAAANEVR